MHHLAAMGGDCCAPDSLPAAQHMLNDLHLNNAENEGGNTAKAASAKTHQECAKELEDFIRKRIELFDQYKSREDAKVCVYIFSLVLWVMEAPLTSLQSRGDRQASAL